MVDSVQVPAAAPAPAQVALKGLCPRCGAPGLFAGMVGFASACRACGLDFDAFNVGDGPAAFLTLGLGALVSILAIVVELAFSPPLWVHLALWAPLAAVMVVGSLRLAKGMLIALEYRNAAREGRVAGPRA